MESLDLFGSYYEMHPAVWPEGEVEVAISLLRLWRAIVDPDSAEHVLAPLRIPGLPLFSSIPPSAGLELSVNLGQSHRVTTWLGTQPLI